MNRDKAIFIACIVLLQVGLAGCDTGQGPLIPDLDTGEVSVNQPVGEQAPPSQNKVMLMGTWSRVDLIVDGVQQPFVPATLTLQEDTFVGSGTCTTTGNLSAEEETFTMVMTESNCPRAILPLTLTYSYQIVDDGKKLITMTANVVETYSKE